MITLCLFSKALKLVQHMSIYPSNYHQVNTNIQQKTSKSTFPPWFSQKKTLSIPGPINSPYLIHYRAFIKCQSMFHAAVWRQSLMGVRLDVEAHSTRAEWQTNSREVNTTGLMVIRMGLKFWMSEKIQYSPTLILQWASTLRHYWGLPVNKLLTRNFYFQ